MMDTLMINQLYDHEYIGIVSILDYEVRLSDYLKNLSFPSEVGKRKVIVDMALKSGINKYRFVEFEVDTKGKIILSSNNYVNPNNELKSLANSFLKNKRNNVQNSVLPLSSQKKILEN